MLAGCDEADGKHWTLKRSASWHTAWRTFTPLSQAEAKQPQAPSRSTTCCSWLSPRRPVRPGLS